MAPLGCPAAEHAANVGGVKAAGCLKTRRLPLKPAPASAARGAVLVPVLFSPQPSNTVSPAPGEHVPTYPPVGTRVAAETLPAPCTHGALRPRPSPGRLFCPRSCHTQVIGESTETSLLKIKHLKLHLIHVCLLFLTHFLFSSWGTLPEALFARD